VCVCVCVCVCVRARARHVRAGGQVGACMRGSPCGRTALHAMPPSPSLLLLPPSPPPTCDPTQTSLSFDPCAQVEGGPVPLLRDLQVCARGAGAAHGGGQRARRGHAGPAQPSGGWAGQGADERGSAAMLAQRGSAAQRPRSGPAFFFFDMDM